MSGETPAEVSGGGNAGTGWSNHVLAELNDRFADSRRGPEAVLNAVTSALSRLRRGTWVAYLIGKDPRSVKVVAANEKNPQMARYLEDMHRSGEASALSFADQVIETGEPLLLPHLTREDFLSSLRTDVHSYFAKKAPPLMAPWVDVGVMVVPMRSRGATVGSLALYEARPSEPLSRQDVEWLQPIADRTGLAADNAQLYADANSRLERLAAIRSVSMAMAASGDLRLTLQVILDHVLVGLGVDAADILIVEPDGNLLSVSHAGFRSTAVPVYRLEPGNVPASRLFDKPRIEILTGGVLAQFKRRTLFAREGFRAYCAAPLVARGRPVGVLELFHRSTLDVDDEWLGFLDAISGFTAVAIDNAAMSDALRQVASPPAPFAGAPKLSNLEREILTMVVEGTTNAAIAKELHLSQSTVKFHVRQILQKVGVGNRTELARLATREGWT